jgi:hypothetical protein
MLYCGMPHVGMLRVLQILIYNFFFLVIMGFEFRALC